MKRKILAIALCGAMGCALLAGCGSSGTSDSADAAAGADETEAAVEDAGAEDAAEEEADAASDISWPEETVKIGVEVYDTTDEQYLALKNYLDYLTGYFNVSFVYSDSIADVNEETEFIESCASDGCQAIMGYYNVDGAKAIQRTVDAGMYYWGTEQYYYQFEDNDLYLGCYTFVVDEENEGYSGDYLGGYQMAYSLGEQGIQHVFYCNGGVALGVKMFIDRQEGFIAGIEAAQADGYSIAFDEDSDIIEGWPGTDEFNAAVEEKLAGDYDGAAVSFNAASLFEPVAAAGKSDSISIATIGETSGTYYDAVHDGLVTCIVYDCEEVVFGNAVVQILNAVTGHDDVTRNDDGTAGMIETYRWTVTDTDTFDAIYNFHNDGNFFVTADDVTNMMADLNEGVTFDDINAYYSAIDKDTAISGIQ